MAVGDGVATGMQDEETWRSLGDWMVVGGLLQDGVDTAAVVTNDYLPEQ